MGENMSWTSVVENDQRENQFYWCYNFSPTIYNMNFPVVYGKLSFLRFYTSLTDSIYINLLQAHDSKKKWEK